MSDSYVSLTQDFKSIIDFLRFGLSCAYSTDLYYGHGTDNAWDDMLALILGALSLPLDTDPMLFQAKLTANEKKILCERLEKRIVSRIPVPYLTHQSYFCGLSFYVDERVLIPRSPIGELISQQFSPWIEPENVKEILDLCTGSGCIAIACCYAFPDALVDAIDISAEALDVAEINKKNHNLHGSLELIESDCFANVPNKKYDIIVSNPPYVSFDEMQTLPEEYHHEPKLALQASNEGLALVEKILFNAHAYLNDHGILVIEVGNSEEALLNAYPHVPFTWLDFERGGQGVFLLTAKQVKKYFTSQHPH